MTGKVIPDHIIQEDLLTGHLQVPVTILDATDEAEGKQTRPRSPIADTVLRGKGGGWRHTLC